MSEQAQEQAGGQSAEGALGKLDQIMAALSDARVSDAAPSDLDEEKTSVGDGLAFALVTYLQQVSETQNSPANSRELREGIDRAIAAIDRKLSAQVDAILHNETFQKLESAWRGLYYTVSNTDFRQPIMIDLIDTTKEELFDDHDANPVLTEMGYFKQVYTQEYDQPGASPISCIIGNFDFENTSRDLALLERLSKVSAGAHAPFIAAVGSSFFGRKNVQEMAEVNELADVFKGKEYIKWRAFRDSEESRYVGLTFPRILLREPYNPEGLCKAKSFTYLESVSGEQHERYLWGNAAWAFSKNLARSFSQHGWFTQIRGKEAGGQVEGLPLHRYDAGGIEDVKIPTEILIPDRREFEFAQQGFIPLSYYRDTDYAVFFSAQSAQKPADYGNKSAEQRQATASSRLSANLANILVVSRVSHYLKVIQRDNIGKNFEREDLEDNLRRWIKNYMTEDPKPSQAAKAKYPFREAKIEVRDFEENPGFYAVEILLRPHFQFEGANISLSLVSKTEKPK